MKKSKKFIALALSVAVILVCSVAPTFSWLSDESEQVVNTFAGGSISIKLDEAKVDAKGHRIDGEPRVTANSYKYTAGSILDKDPTPTVLKDSDSCYVFTFVENELNDLFSIDIQTENWLKVAESTDGTLYVYKAVVKETDTSSADVVLSPVFTKVTVSEALTQDDVAALGDKTVKVTSYAVQSDGLDSNSAIDIAVAHFCPGATPDYVTVS
ncbi:MAG: hypothetical protein ACI4IL_01410 [Eubacterium sp.]